MSPLQGFLLFYNLANTYTQIYIHLVFVVKGRENLIKNQKQKMLAINGMPDHIHIFFGMEPTVRLSDLVRDIKANSSRFINENKFVKGKYNWQTGYGAFSYSRSHKERVINYILDQEKHHTKAPLKNEFIELLKNFEINYDERYLFEWIE